jgi:hypothetical protein
MSDATRSTSRPAGSFFARCRHGALGLAALAAGVALASPAEAQFVNLTATLDGGQEVPPNTSPATGTGCFTLDQTALTLSYQIQFSGLTASQTDAHIHGFAPPGVSAPVLFPLPQGSPIAGTIQVTQAQAAQIFDGQTYVNIHSASFPNGEIRGQILRAPTPTLFCFGDGSTGLSCPCGNDSAPGGQIGCLNSTGSGGKLVADGFASVFCDTLKLSASGMPGTSTTVYIQGTTLIAAVKFGDGTRCIGGSLTRLSVVSNVNGQSFIPGNGSPTISQLGGITTPATYFYQVYYRDPNLAFCPAPPGNSFNITNGAKVTWVP